MAGGSVRFSPASREERPELWEFLDRFEHDDLFFRIRQWAAEPGACLVVGRDPGGRIVACCVLLARAGHLWVWEPRVAPDAGAGLPRELYRYALGEAAARDARKVWAPVAAGDEEMSRLLSRDLGFSPAGSWEVYEELPVLEEVASRESAGLHYEGGRATRAPGALRACPGVSGQLWDEGRPLAVRPLSPFEAGEAREGSFLFGADGLWEQTGPGAWRRAAGEGCVLGAVALGASGVPVARLLVEPVPGPIPFAGGRVVVRAVEGSGAGCRVLLRAAYGLAWHLGCGEITVALREGDVPPLRQLLAEWYRYGGLRRRWQLWGRMVAPPLLR